MIRRGASPSQKLSASRRGVLTWRRPRRVAATTLVASRSGVVFGISWSRSNRRAVRCTLGDADSTASHMRVSTGPGATSVVRMGVLLNSRRNVDAKLLRPALVSQ